MLSEMLTVVVAILVLGLLYVVLPIVAGTYRRMRATKVVLCPRTNRVAGIRLDANQAALTAAVGRPDLQVTRCTRWPAFRDCGRECVAEVDPVSGDVHVV